MVRRCWVNSSAGACYNFTVGQGSAALAVGAGWGLFGLFYSHLSFHFSYSLSLGDGPI